MKNIRYVIEKYIQVLILVWMPFVMVVNVMKGNIVWCIIDAWIIFSTYNNFEYRKLEREYKLEL